MKVQEWHKNNLTVSTDQTKLPVEIVHHELNKTYWANGIPLEVVKKAMKHSLCFGVYDSLDGQILGFGRVVTDQATFAYLTDFVVLEKARAQGVGKFLVQCVLEHPDLQNLRRITLATLDAHGLYKQFGFNATKEPQNWMEIKNERVYQR